MTDFELFQSEFKKWQQKFGLMGHQVYFKYEPLKERFADLDVNTELRVATVRLNSKLDADETPFKDIKKSAKHEAIHLLLDKLEDCAFSRYIRQGEIVEATEELVVKLMELIP